MSRVLSKKTKDEVLAKNGHRCANYPGSNLFRLENYECPMWKLNNGHIDRSCYDFDHIIEYSLTKDSTSNNIQILCLFCHRIKTNSFKHWNKKDNTSSLEDDKTKVKKKIRKPIETDEETKKTILIKLFRVNNLTTGDQLKTKKGIKNINQFELFFCKYYPKQIHYLRYEKMFGYITDIDLNNKLRIKIIFNFINILSNLKKSSYTPDDLKCITITTEQFNQRIKKISIDSIYYKNEEYNRSLFFKTKGVTAPYSDETKLTYEANIRLLFDWYNIALRSRRVQKNKIQSIVHDICIDNEMKNLVEFKHGIVDKVANYDLIFKTIIKPKPNPEPKFKSKSKELKNELDDYVEI